MATAESVKAQIIALVNACKQVTGISSNNLTTQVNALLSGYSGGTLTIITLLASNWALIEDGKYSQVVDAVGVTENSRVNLYPSASQITQLENYGIAITAENNGGVVTVYSLNGKPDVNLTIQASLMDVANGMGIIYGNVIGVVDPIKTIVFVDENGHEVAAGVVVDQETVFTATSNDIVAGKIAATEIGITVGTHEC